MKHLGIISLILILFLAACKPEPPIDIIDPIPEEDLIENYEPVVENVTTSLRGQVQDENQQPVEGATVKLGNLTTTTNQFGHFFFKNKTMNSRGQLIKIDVPGYFPGSRRFFPTPNTENRITVELLSKVFDQSFDAVTGGVLYLPNSGSIVFEDKSIEDANGNTYVGNVNAAAKWMDPSAPSTLDQMPGNLQGVNTDSDEVVLATYGMIAVELEDNNGQPLNIAENKTATITMPVPSSMLASAPTQIPLWSYNESYGVWKQESVANLINGMYVGEVSHFSFWNCDIPSEYVYFDARAVNEDDIPLAGMEVKIVSPTFGTRSGITALDGTVSGIIPAGELLSLEVWTCNTLVSLAQFGPATQDLSYGDVVVSSLSFSTTTILGEVVCNGNLLNEAVIKANRDGQVQYYYTFDGQFEFQFIDCTNSLPVEVSAFDIVGGSQGPAVNVQGGVISNLGQIEACDNSLQSYVNINVDGTTKRFFFPTSNTSVSYTSIWATDLINNGSLGLYFPGITAGDYSNNPENNIFVEYQPENWYIQSDSLSTIQKFNTFFVTEHSSIKVEGSFTGTVDNYYNNTVTNVPITGYFHVVQ